MPAIAKTKDWFGTDEVMKSVAAAHPISLRPSTHNVFHDLMSCIIEQQIHYRTSKNVFANILRESGVEELTPDNFDHLEPVLGKRNLSAVKLEAVAATLDFFLSNDIPWATLSDDEVRQALSHLVGVGRWTVDMLLVYTLRRPDVFPVDDYHLKQVMVKLYALDPNRGLRQKMLERAGEWEGSRSLGTLHLLAWKDANIKRPRS